MLTRLQLHRKYDANLEFKNAFVQTFSARLILARSVVLDGYEPPQEFVGSIFLNPTGQELFENLVNSSGCKPHFAKIAVFLDFYFDDLYVACEKSDHVKMLSILSTELLSGRLRMPWIYDRELYDRFTERIGKPLSKLNFDQTEAILTGSSVGVFQLGTSVIGPFGILTSSQSRELLPTRNLPLWHCSDASCRALHGVDMWTGHCPEVVSLMQEISRIQSAGVQDSSGWFGLYSDYIKQSDWYDHRNYSTLPWLVANTFVESELRLLVAHLLESSQGRDIRSRLPNDPRNVQRFRRDAKSISNTMSKSECLQTLLLSDDSFLVRAIEAKILDGTIVIPATETRRHRFSRGTSSALDVEMECSKRGIRFRYGSQEFATNTMRALIRHLYLPDDSEELQWKLRKVDGQTIQEKIDRFIHFEEPTRIVQDLVFTNRDKLDQSLTFFGMPVSADLPLDESSITDIMLWKAGFSSPLYPDYDANYYKRLEALRLEAQTCGEYSEADKERIRSAAVNFFVSVEEILDIAIAFSTWLLLNDHILTTRFEFELSAARRFMATLLNGRKRGDIEITIESERQNTLYPMTQAFALLADLCEQMLSENLVEKRSHADLPGYVGRSQVLGFPFRHYSFLGDVRANEREFFLKSLRHITSELEVAHVCEIRNRLEHKRDDFPTHEQISKVCAAMKAVMQKMQETGICPSVFARTTTTTDMF